MKRHEIDDKYKWDLSAICPSDEEWENMFREVAKNMRQITSFKRKLGNREKLLACFELSGTLSQTIERIFCYARMKKDENSLDDKYVSMSNRAEGLMIQFGTYSSFIESELSTQSEEYLLSIAEDEAFSEYDYMIKEIVRQKQHILSDKEERLLAMSHSATGGYNGIFSMLDYVDLPLPKIRVNGERKQLTLASYAYYLESRDENLRKTAFKGLYKAYKSLINTLSATFSGSIKSDNFYALARGYKSCLEKALFVDDVPVAVYNNLIANVGKSLPYLHEYMGLRKQVLGVDKLHMYDLTVPMVAEYDMSLPYEEAYEVVMEGLKPLGEEYAELLRRARDDKWIDVYENEGKRSGAYSWGAYGAHPYVLLNYSQTAHDVFTIAHELGHAMHSYYSDLSLPYVKAAYKIFVAEVASTVNEVLLIKDLLAKADNPEMRKYLLTYYLDMFRTTVFRQTQFAEYEKVVHDMEQKGKPLTVDSLSKAYFKLNKKYYGKNITHDAEIKLEWARIPHFYNAFYVYKYATGLTSAIYIAVNIIKNPEYLEKYKAFLSAGGAKSPYEILKDTGVDLATNVPYEVAMKEFADTLAALKEEFKN